MTMKHVDYPLTGLLIRIQIDRTFQFWTHAGSLFIFAQTNGIVEPAKVVIIMFGLQDYTITRRWRPIGGTAYTYM